MIVIKFKSGDTLLIRYIDCQYINYNIEHKNEDITKQEDSKIFEEDLIKEFIDKLGEIEYRTKLNPI